MTQPAASVIDLLKPDGHLNEETRGLLHMLRANILPRLHHAEAKVQELESRLTQHLQSGEFEEHIHQNEMRIGALENWTGVHSLGRVVAAGKLDTIGGSTTQLVPFAVQKSMMSLAMVCKRGTSPVYIQSAHCDPDAGGVVITFSGDPSTDHSFSYVVFAKT